MLAVAMCSRPPGPGLPIPSIWQGPLDLFSPIDCIAELGVGLDHALDAGREEQEYGSQGHSDSCSLSVASAQGNAYAVAAAAADRNVSLAWENLEHVPKPLAAGLAGLGAISVLDLSHNKLRDLDFLSALPSLNSLVLDHNLIREDVELPRLPRLRLLWLNHNQLRSIQPLAKRLQRAAPRLRHLSLIGNKAAPSPLTGAEPGECARYRLSMVWQLPQLRHLDERPVSEPERARSKHLQLRAIFNSMSQIPTDGGPHATGAQRQAGSPAVLRRNTCI